jgi:hypothetical protein
MGKRKKNGAIVSSAVMASVLGAKKLKETKKTSSAPNTAIKTERAAMIIGMVIASMTNSESMRAGSWWPLGQAT